MMSNKEKINTNNTKTSKKKKFFGKKRPKIQLTFDTNERKQFLTGFEKRKAERKIKAKEVLESELKEEKNRQKVRQRERLKSLYENQRSVPEVQHLLADEPTLTYELPKQMVSITAFDAKHISGSLGLTLGHNQSRSVAEIETQCEANGSHESEDENSESCVVSTIDLPKKIRNMRKELKNSRLKSIKSSNALKRQQKLKHKKDLTEAKHKRKSFRKEIKNMKQKTLLKNLKANKKRNKKNSRRNRRNGLKK